MFSRVMMIITTLCIALLGVGLWQAIDQPVRTYVVKGDLTASERQHVQQVLGAGAGAAVDGLLSTALDEVVASVRALPWAKEVSVRRQWPDKLVITLHRARPVARWGDTQYLSVQGELFELPDEYVGLPRFNVQLSSPQQSMQVYRLLDQLASHEDLAIRELSENELGEWSMQMNAARGTLQVILGNEQIGERMRRFVSAYRYALQSSNRDVEYVDARYVNGLAVKFADAPVDNLLAALQTGVNK